MSTPVVFIHGLWLHATSWASWTDLFRDAGYETSAPGWPGEPDTVDDVAGGAAVGSEEPWPHDARSSVATTTVAHAIPGRPRAMVEG